MISKREISAIKQQAIADGKKHYISDKPCKNGHLALRDVASGTCMACIQAKRRAMSSKPEEMTKYESTMLELRIVEFKPEDESVDKPFTFT